MMQQIRIKKGIDPFFTYFGGKWRIALTYPRPKYPTIVEPFAGAAGYAVRYFDRQVTLYDVNPRIVGTWEYLIKVTSAEIMSLPLWFDDVRTLSVPQEAKWLIGWWLNKGASEPRNMFTDWRDTSPDSHWGSIIRARLAKNVNKIRHWKSIQGTYQDIDNIEATWFIDPPYVKAGKCYTFSDVDYLQLAKWCRARNGQAIVCEQEGASWLPFSFHVNAKCNTKGNGSNKDIREVIWTKG